MRFFKLKWYIFLFNLHNFIILLFEKAFHRTSILGIKFSKVIAKNI
ncbi:hypothetical protein HMPREF1982_01302 [Clostridiales bacterium oral taxon 876 str. F0540]|nr:hypothetical protein HMPREF1982_01302 [Clostridiales bacterium oral taxon 876 str. F0540]